jgi:hypothetical protein
MAAAETIQERVLSRLVPTATADQPYLAIYMNDQLALGVLWREIARRAQRENAGSPLGAALDRVAGAIAEDVRTFEQLMGRVNVPRTPAKPLLAIAGERLGRLKLNGRLSGYSPLSRFEELDVLLMGIDGKVVLWTTLRDHAGLGARLPDVDFDGLIDRARRQRAELEPFHAEAGREALAAG